MFILFLSSVAFDISLFFCFCFSPSFLVSLLVYLSHPIFCFYLIIIITLGVSRSWQHSRCYIAAEHEAELKIRQETWSSQKHIEELKVGDSERRRDTHGEAMTSRKGKTDYGNRILEYSRHSNRTWKTERRTWQQKKEEKERNREQDHNPATLDYMASSYDLHGLYSGPLWTTPSRPTGGNLIY